MTLNDLVTGHLCQLVWEAAECLSSMPSFSYAVHANLILLLLPNEYLVSICDLCEEEKHLAYI